MTDSTELIRELIALVGPPGEEKAVAAWVRQRLIALGYTPIMDPKGNVLVKLEGRPGGGPNVLVTAHMDEIATMITHIEEDGKIRIAAYGGSYPWKWGEGAMDILTRDGTVTGILSFGGIHTNNEKSVAEYARHNPLTWDRAYVFTGMNRAELEAKGVRVGLRVVLSPSRRGLTEFGAFIAGYFLDDRADIAVMLLALEMLKSQPEGEARYGQITFAATASEEVGGEGALWIMNQNPPDICIALEIGPKTVDADFPIDAQPTLWVRDAYAAMDAYDGDLLTDCCEDLGQTPHWQYLSRGGSDASCAAAKGLCARPVTLGLPVENSHGYEIMRRAAPNELARLLLQYLKYI